MENDRNTNQHLAALDKISSIARDTGYLQCLTDLIDLATQPTTTQAARETILMAATMLRLNVKG